MTAPWGKLTVTAGALIAPDFRRVSVTAPSDPSGQVIHGDGWQLELKPDWHVVPDKQSGCYRLSHGDDRKE